MRRISAIVAACALAVAGSMPAPARAVSTSHWAHGNEADFKAGTTHNVVVTNLGDVKLSRAVQSIATQDPKVNTVNALAEGPDGVVYAGTGPKGVLLSVKGDKVDTVATIDDAESILSLLVDAKGGLLIGTSGDKGKVFRIDKPGDKPREIFAEDGVQYVWSLTSTPDGNIYAATGPNGQLFEIKPDGSHSQLYKSGENNFTSLASDGKDLLYVGTDPNGMVVRINRKTKESFVLYNAGETEITALALDGAGNLFAATGESGDRQPGAAGEQPNKDKSGRPEDTTGGAPIPTPPQHAPPKPPEMPNPNPGEPKPIPKKQTSLLPMHAPMMMDSVWPTKSARTQPSTDDDAGNNAPDPSGPANPGQGPEMGNGPGIGPKQQPNPNLNPGNAGEARPEGNAIYKIDKDGFVTEIFRQNVVIYSMIVQDGVLLVGTGGDGNIYQVNPVAEETVVLAKVDAKQVLALLPTKDGRVFMGLANTGGISAMTSGYSTDGFYTSPVLDATQVSRFGKIQLHGFLPDGTSLKISTRSGNVKDSDAAGWSKWSDETSAAEYIPVTSPSARFLQYRLTFATNDATKSAIVDHVDVAYQIPNLAPVIKSVKIGGDAAGAAPGGPPMPNMPGHAADNTPKPQGTGVQAITWEASDPNNDTLTYSLYFRLENHGPWILLKDKLKDPTFEWDTHAVADGRYQVKVVASDAAGNPPGTGKTASRVSDYFVVDNTPPTIGDLVWKAAGNGVKIDLRAQDQTSTITNVEYTIDSSDDWQAVLPVDNIFDSPDETVSFTVTGLTPGAHQVTIRATDSRGNQALQTVVVKVEGGNARND